MPLISTSHPLPPPRLLLWDDPPSRRTARLRGYVLHSHAPTSKRLTLCLALLNNPPSPYPSAVSCIHSRAVTQWAGKTIALGTFPQNEAEEKCARAKALTRAWRSTMRPKPTREWVMLELERLGVRVVSGRLGRRGDEDDDGGDDGDDGSNEDGGGNMANNNMGMNNNNMGGNMMGMGNNMGMGNMGGMGMNNQGGMNQGMGGGGNNGSAAYEAARADHYRK